MFPAHPKLQLLYIQLSEVKEEVKKGSKLATLTFVDLWFGAFPRTIVISNHEWHELSARIKGVANWGDSGDSWQGSVREGGENGLSESRQPSSPPRAGASTTRPEDVRIVAFPLLLHDCRAEQEDLSQIGH